MNHPEQYVCAGSRFATVKEPVPAPYLRKCFTITKDVTVATLVITGLGYYEAYMNARNITKGPLAPYRSNPDHIVYFDRYTPTSELHKGKNVLGILLGNGFQNSTGGYIWDFDKADFRGAPKTAFTLTIEYTDGTKDELESDTDMRIAPSPILFDDLHFGEYYDARNEIQGWNLPDYDDSSWAHAVKAPHPSGEACLCEAEPITVRKELHPISVTKQDDSFVYDFGINTAGVCRLKIHGQKGQKVLLQHGEKIRDGRVVLNNFRFHEYDRYQEDEYTCKGANVEEYTPHFTYHGFRYVVVSGVTAEQATPDLLTFLVMGSNLQENGHFHCDNDIINKIQAAVVNSDTSNFFYFPTDCPQREKNGWTADAALSAEQCLLNLTPENSYREWMRSIYKALTGQGKLPGMIPTGGWGYHWGNGPAWDNVLVYLPYYTYKLRGDRRILEELAAPLMRYLTYLYSRLNDKDLMEIGLGDWCPPGKNEDKYGAPLIVTDSIMTVDIAEKAAFIYSELGLKPHQQFAEKLASRVRAAFRRELIDSKTMVVKGDCQTCQAMALHYGLFEEAEKPAALSYLLKLIEKADGHFDTGVLGGKVIYDVLAENGQAELAYHMIVRPDYPSYGNWVLRGYTSMMESFQPEGGRLLSLNHHFWGFVSAWFYRVLAGIQINPTGRDVTEVTVAPTFIDELSHVQADVNTPNGAIAVEWERSDKGVTLTVKADNALHGKIVAPQGWQFADGAAELELKPGTYAAVRQ